MWYYGTDDDLASKRRGEFGNHVFLDSYFILSRFDGANKQ